MWQLHDRSAKAAAPGKGGFVDKILPVLSVFTMVMTVPQVWSVWVQHDVAGVSLLSWGAYLVSALFWMAHGLQRRDPAIWVACIGWVLLDAAIVAGIVWPH